MQEKKIRAWQNTDNDVAKCKAGISGHGKGERYQVMDFVSVGMNAASVVDEFRMLLKRVTFESSRRRRRRNNNNKNQGEKKENKKILFSSHQTFKSKQEPFFHILYRKNDHN